MEEEKNKHSIYKKYGESEESGQIQAGLAYALSIRETANTAVGSAVWRGIRG
jgi:hypothetical protein